LARAPGSVRVIFDQPVQPDNGGLAVLDSSANKVSIASEHPQPDELVARLPSSLPGGAFVANYTVTSVDGHIVSGGIVFLVGHASVGQIARLTRQTPAGPQDLSDAGQALLYLGVLGAGGLAFFLAFVMDDGPEVRVLRRLTVGSVAVAVVGMVVTLWGQASLLAGDVASALHWGNVNPTLGGKFGLQCGLQLLGLASCLWSLWTRPPVARQVLAFYGVLVAAGAFAVFGHAVASPDRAVAIPADVVHAVVAALWFGGLLALVLVLHSRLRGSAQDANAPGPSNCTPEESPAPARVGPVSGPATAVLERPAFVVSDTEFFSGGAALRTTADLVGRFSTMAAISVALLMAAGLTLAVVEVGSFANLVDTGYGQLLVVKLGLVGILLFLAAYNRMVLLPYLFAASQGGRGSGVVASGWRRLRATARLELLGVVLVLVVTTLLANGTPSNGASVGPPVPLSVSRPFASGRMSLRITPNQALVNDFVVQFTGPGGKPADLAESVSVYLVLPSQDIGPIETDLKHVGVGRFALRDSPYPPIVGTWQIVLQVQVSEFQETDVSFTDRVN
jgi:copper transport protein